MKDDSRTGGLRTWGGPEVLKRVQELPGVRQFGEHGGLLTGGLVAPGNRSRPPTPSLWFNAPIQHAKRDAPGRRGDAAKMLQGSADV